MRYLLALLTGLMLALPAAGQVIWNPAFEADPADPDPVSEGDDRIRELKLENRERVETEHCFGNNDTDGCNGPLGGDDGRHREGSAVVFFETTAPTALHATDYDSTGGGGAGATLEEGRIWVDSDDRNRPYVYDGSAFVALNGSQSLGPNLVYGGSFEATDGDGDVASISTPVGWADAATVPDYAYTTIPAAQGVGFEVTLTAGPAETDAGMTQTLGGLRASTSYVLEARAQPQVGGDSCTVRTTGADTDASATVSAGTAYTRLTDVFITDATPTDVVVIAEADGNSDACSFDFITVRELRSDDLQPVPGTIPFRAVGADNNTACNDTTYTLCAGLASVTVVPPGPGYIVQINAWASVDAGGIGDSCKLRIFDGSSTLVESGFTTARANAFRTWSLSYMTTTPLTPGSSTTFQIDVSDENQASDTCATTNDLAGTTISAPHGIEVLLIHTDG